MAESAFDDLLVLRERGLEYQQAFKDLVDNTHSASSNELEDLLVRCDILIRTEAIARTLDIGCHPLNFIDP